MYCTTRSIASVHRGCYLSGGNAHFPGVTTPPSPAQPRPFPMIANHAHRPSSPPDHRSLSQLRQNFPRSQRASIANRPNNVLTHPSAALTPHRYLHQYPTSSRAPNHPTHRFHEYFPVNPALQHVLHPHHPPHPPPRHTVPRRQRLRHFNQQVRRYTFRTSHLPEPWLH